MIHSDEISVIGDMANSYSSIYYHVVFSTKDRRSLIPVESENRLWAYLAGIIKAEGGIPCRIGGVENHVHLLFRMPPTSVLSDLMRRLKPASTIWMKANVPGVTNFAWQDGYAAFSVSKSSVPSVETYITGQRAHHEKFDFPDEYRKLLDAHDVAYEQRYLF